MRNLHSPDAGRISVLEFFFEYLKRGRPRAAAR